ncbi:MAG: GAF domain-containing protein [Firmicutes bacterium]|nr:GAF domain-containing protein [Alicyclobacillaceae bacterium]MCL6496450.1 GAF domain-containing protein [Bacillota bacterium]
MADVLQRKVQELNALIKVNARITSQLGLEPLLQTVVDAARELVGAAMGGLLVLDPIDPTRYEFFKVSGWPGPAGFPEGRGLFALPYKTGRPLRVDNIRLHPDSVGTPPGHPPVGALLAVPLVMREHMLGSLFLAHVPGGPTFTAEDEELLMAFSTQAAIAIENARLYAKAEQLAVLQERARISQRLHDSVSQIFFVLGIEVERLWRLTAGQPAAWVEGLQRIRTLVAQGASETRAAIFSLREEVDLDRPPARMLAELVEQFHRTSGIETSLVTLGPLDRVPPPLWRCAIKVIAESLNNVRRHSGSPVASVSVSYDGQTLSLSVQDAGRGIPQPDLAEWEGSPTHYGIRSMRRLVEELHGTFTIFRNDEGGTTVRVQLPRRPA